MDAKRTTDQVRQLLDELLIDDDGNVLPAAPVATAMSATGGSPAAPSSMTGATTGSGQAGSAASPGGGSWPPLDPNSPNALEEAIFRVYSDVWRSIINPDLGDPTTPAAAAAATAGGSGRKSGRKGRRVVLPPDPSKGAAARRTRESGNESPTASPPTNPPTAPRLTAAGEGMVNEAPLALYGRDPRSVGLPRPETPNLDAAVRKIASEHGGAKPDESGAAAAAAAARAMGPQPAPVVVTGAAGSTAPPAPTSAAAAASGGSADVVAATVVPHSTAAGSGPGPAASTSGPAASRPGGTAATGAAAAARGSGGSHGGPGGPAAGPAPSGTPTPVFLIGVQPAAAATIAAAFSGRPGPSGPGAAPGGDAPGDGGGGGKFSQILKLVTGVLRNPSNIASLLGDAGKVFGASEATAASLSTGGLVAAALLAAQYGVRKVGHGAIETAGSLVAEPATEKVAHDVFQAATGGPMDWIALIKAVPEWTQALLDSKRGIAMFNGELQKTFSEAERREFLRASESGERTGAAASKLSGDWQDFLDTVQPMKDDLYVIATIVTRSGITMTKILAGILQMVEITSGIKGFVDWWRSRNSAKTATNFEDWMEELSLVATPHAKRSPRTNRAPVR